MKDWDFIPEQAHQRGPLTEAFPPLLGLPGELQLWAAPSGDGPVEFALLRTPVCSQIPKGIFLTPWQSAASEREDNSILPVSIHLTTPSCLGPAAGFPFQILKNHPRSVSAGPSHEGCSAPPPPRGSRTPTL